MKKKDNLSFRIRTTAICKPLHKVGCTQLGKVQIILYFYSFILTLYSLKMFIFNGQQQTGRSEWNKFYL